jgi:lipopolysaccharide assembly outer membrane protein LptD (OstA)
MKRIIKYVLIIFLILISLFSYNFFFKKKTQTKNVAIIQENLENIQNNIIRNLEYNINLSNGNKYFITAESGVLSYNNNVETIDMTNALAKVIYSDNTSITISSNKAVYNNNNYNSFFRENVKIIYSDNLIYADKMSLNFFENKIKIYENVKYIGSYGQLKTDNISIDLLTKEIQIYMDNEKDNIKIITK